MIKTSYNKAAGESKPEAYPQGYVEDFDETRTPLDGVFIILLKRQCPLHYRHTLPPHFDRLDDIVVRLDPHDNLRRTLDLIPLLDNYFCRWCNIYHSILDQVGSYRTACAAGRRVFKNPN